MHRPLTIRTRALLIWTTWTISVSLGSLTSFGLAIRSNESPSLYPCSYPLFFLGIFIIYSIFQQSDDHVMAVVVWQLGILGQSVGFLHGIVLFLTFDFPEEPHNLLLLGVLGVTIFLVLIIVFFSFVQQRRIWIPVLAVYTLLIIAASVYVYRVLSQLESLTLFDIRAEVGIWMIISVGFGGIPGVVLARVMRTIPPAIARKYQARIDRNRQRNNTRTSRWLRRGGIFLCVVVLGWMSISTIKQNLQPCQSLDVVMRRSGCVQVLDSYGDAFAFSPDGTLLAFPDYTEVMHIYDTSDWQLVRSLKTRQKSYYPEVVLFSPDSSLLVKATRDYIHMWRMEDGTLIHSWSTVEEEGRYGVTPYIAFSPDGEQFAMNTGEYGLVIRNTSSGRLLRILREEGSLSPDWTMLATRSHVQRLSDGVAVSNIATGYFTEWSPASSMIAAAEPFEGVAEVWHVEDSTLLHTLRYAEMMQSHGWQPEGRVYSELAWSPDGSMLLVGATYVGGSFDDDIPDGGVWIWRVSDGDLLWSVVLEDGVDGVIWLPDGEHFATQSSGDTQIWCVPPQP